MGPGALDGAQSGFATTDLDLQLKQHGIGRVVLAGVPANTCVESTSRFAMELGHHVTLVPDAAAALLPEMMHAAHELNGPTFAHAIVTTDRPARRRIRFDAARPHA
ncbi:isochorismatase family protein [Streptomyces sp. NPDC005708]|uniref:isochorismatase family protein n=1 Tax=Streptomyces sp. NPDC005708 TaxID=3154564 RepID=UPI0033F693A6